MEKLIQYKRYMMTEGVGSASADDLFKKGLMPDGEKWTGGKPSLFFKVVNDPVVTKEKKTDKGDTVQYAAHYRFVAGKGGGAGISMDATASNHWFNVAGTGSGQIREMQDAIGKAARGDSRKLNAQIMAWFKDPENFVWRIVGWKDRKSYTISDVTFRGVRYLSAMIDPARRKWPAGRTEVWIPVEVDVVATVKRK